MILLHDDNVELSRELLETIPDGVEVIHGSGGYQVSAFPNVVVNTPDYADYKPTYRNDSAFLGMLLTPVLAHTEIIRMPASWDAVNSYLNYINSHATAA